MALTSGRKLCKLDAICAKLKQISNKEQTKLTEENGIGGGGEKEEPVPTDLSTKCSNNNIIGKADLNTLDNEDVESNGLDLSKKAKIDPNIIKNNENGVDSEVEESNHEAFRSDNVGGDDYTREFKSVITETSKVKPAVGSGRRKRAIPRSISQVRDYYDHVDSKDELAEYEINNQNTNFPPEDTYESEKDTSGSGRDSLSCSNDFSHEATDLSLSNNSKFLGHSGESFKSRHSSDFDISNNISTPLDLSMSRSKDDDDSINGYLSSEEDDVVDDDDDDDDDFFHPDRNLVIDETKQTIQCSVPNSASESPKNVGSEQAARLKDYAESTMNELISMYGFGGTAGHHSDISKQLPMMNFKAILQQQGSDQMSPGATRSSVFSNYSNHPMSSGDEESRDSSTPMKGLYSSKIQGNSKAQNDRFTTSSSFINAVYNSNSGQTTPGQLTPGLPNYSKYLKRYNNGTECGGQHCNDLGYREHYHCIDCSFQVFIKKEEMVRHYKWHRKREESLQHGFLRFSPLDNCTKRFGNCTHNGKQTHYHCLQNGCDKVYISTSDVQMHANYHRKDSAIMSEGFQRFRATEDCGTMSCSFYGQRTTHFHCLRPDCKFTFKNKADMEKHKSYHQKDEVLGRDGFKKFMKYEHCMFPRCRYSKVSNHIHCIRSGCDYVLHSTAQLYSHKRKHERRDFESAYKKYRDNHQSPPQPANKLILPRTDFGTIQQLASLTGSPVIQTLANVANMSSSLKRQTDWDHQEPLELKKPKLEPGSDVDVSAPTTPSARSSPVEKQIKIEPEDQSMDTESLHSVTDSSDLSPETKSQLSQMYKDGKSLSLSGSLTLPIPMYSGRIEPKSSESPVVSSSANVPLKPVNNLGKGESMFSATSLGSAMPSTLGGSLVSMNPGALLTVPTMFPGPSTVLQPPKSVYTERREKDDSWKTYLVRYTANDPCNPRCQYLYKDHYHCKMDGCLVLFKSKDGVREHARFHELQDRITPIAYQTFEEDEACPHECQYSEKEKHYHCIWTGCNHVVPYVGPTFGRLEHYRIHEYARAAAGKSYNRGGKGLPSFEDNSMRRRGRPPKYPKIELPKIPKVELTDEEIQMSHIQATEMNVTGQTKVINGFRIFSPEDPCPDERCNFIGKLHYHCARPRCFTITDRIDVLNLHAKDFHSFVKILEGYEFFDRNVSCRRIHCPNNQTNRHFHCTRQKCDYSFIRHSTMAQHEKKHQYSGGNSGTSVTPLSPKEVPISPKTFRDTPLSPLLPYTTLSTVSQSSQVGAATSVITSAAAFLQIKSSQSTGIPVFISQPGNITSLSQGPVIVSQQPVGIQDLSLGGTQVALKQAPINVATVPVPISTVQALPASVTASQLVTGLPAPLVTVSGAPITISPIDSNNSGTSSVPLTVLLQRGVNQIPQPSWNELRNKMHYAISQNCGRPFCKLKKKDHYHCFDCNQAFSDPARLRSHIGKHGMKFPRVDSASSVIKHASQVSSPSVLKPQRIENHTENPENSLDPDEAQCLADNGDVSDNESDAEDPKSSSLNLNPSTFSEMISMAQEQNKISTDAESDDDDTDNALHIDTSAEVDYTDNHSDSNEHKSDVSSRSGRKIFKTKKDDFMNSGDINLNKQRQVSPQKNHSKNMTVKSPTASANKVIGTGTRGLRDDSIPEGYSRWRYNEECKYSKCAYRHSVTHFHCIRDDCGYGFSDRSRLVQHTLRHERIDSITGGELQQYRINQDCGSDECEYNKKMSHFHCKRCSYICTDSSKVLTHRKYHAKMDNISNQGFEKHSAADDCGVNLCPYSRKQNHFHCLIESCRAAALGPVQMNTHKAKHTGRDN